MNKTEATASKLNYSLDSITTLLGDTKALRDSLEKDLTEQYNNIIKELRRPKIILRDSDGRISGVK